MISHLFHGYLLVSILVLLEGGANRSWGPDLGEVRFQSFLLRGGLNCLNGYPNSELKVSILVLLEGGAKNIAAVLPHERQQTLVFQSMFYWRGGQKVICWIFTR